MQANVAAQAAFTVPLPCISADPDGMSEPLGIFGIAPAMAKVPTEAGHSA